MKTKPDLEQALRTLILSIQNVGMEYPEAHCYVIELFNLTVKQGETLTQMYDECGGNLK